jgi:hypothetical protein
MHTLAPTDILNMDDTSWKLIGHDFMTVGERGTEGVS